LHRKANIIRFTRASARANISAMKPVEPDAMKPHPGSNDERLFPVPQHAREKAWIDAATSRAVTA